MAKKNKRPVHNPSVLFGDESETSEMSNNQGDQTRKEKSGSFWSGMGRGERIAAIAVCLLLVIGALGAGLGDKIVSTFSSKNSKQGTNQPAQNNGSYLSALNPFVEPPLPTTTPQLSKEYIYAGSRMLAVEDANANAAPPADLAVWRVVNGTGMWYVMGGPGSAQTTGQWGDPGDIPVPGDYDGDGKTDFSVFRPSTSTGTWYISNTSNGYTTEYTYGLANDKVAQADYDGDGRTDMAVVRSDSTAQTTTWYITKSSDQTPFLTQFGLSTDTPAPADFDGDGKADFAVWRGSDLTFYVRKSSDGTPQQQAITGAASDDTPVCADYDGDGKADYAVKNGDVWRIKQSSDGTTQAIAWGLSTDQPVQNDYDGDGRVDIAVWRASDGNWYIRQSAQGNSLRQVAWGAAGDVPVPAFYRR